MERFKSGHSDAASLVDYLTHEGCGVQKGQKMGNRKQQPASQPASQPPVSHGWSETLSPWSFCRLQLAVVKARDDPGGFWWGLGSPLRELWNSLVTHIHVVPMEGWVQKDSA